jgi:hypothetical protein
MALGTNCIGSCKSNYHTVMARFLWLDVLNIALRKTKTVLLTGKKGNIKWIIFCYTLLVHVFLLLFKTWINQSDSFLDLFQF